MIRFRLLRSRRPAWIASALTIAAFAALALPLAAPAQDLIQPKKLDRRFPAFKFCPLPVSADFVADGPVATLQFKGNVFAAGPFGPQYCGQRIDNVAICSTSDYAPNFGFPPQFSPSSSCYTDNHVGSFYFNRGGLALPLLEIFDTDPTARGWDMTHGALYDPDESGPRDPEADADFTGGSLLLGAETPGGTPADSAYTSVSVSGLVTGHAYTVSGWWWVGNIPQDLDTGDPLLNVTLTLRVFGSTSTPIMRRSWGSLKADYR
jgi:hypothetical protein